MLSRTSELASEFAPTKAENLPLDRTNFTPGINRSMAYYTGLSFEIYADGLDRPIATGGRYDDLLQALGAHDKMPAVGGAISLERLARAVEMHS
jgi:ATP phosphoribosyltransferase regulatory subunit